MDEPKQSLNTITASSLDERGRQSLPNSPFRVAYLSMEIGVDQSLHTYAGGLGYLAGSHMRSAYQLGLPMVAVSILWNKGYGDQVIDENGQVRIQYVRRKYPFLKDTGITVEIQFFNEPVKVKAYRLEPETFGTVPIYFLSTDIPENDYKHRYLTDVLYDADEWTRIGQEMVLGLGGIRMLEAMGERFDLIHLNEGHALPALFEQWDRCNGDWGAIKDQSVFTTHTPVAAGNECHLAHFLHEAGYFGKISLEKAVQVGGENFSLTEAALKICRIANAVSQLHGKVANKLWEDVPERCPIIAITNSVDLEYWQDARFGPDTDLLAIKKQMKKELFETVKAESGKDFSPDILTLVWARRFTEYKRPTLIFRDLDRISKLLSANKIQLLFAGKFHPADTTGQYLFNQVLEYARTLPNIAVLPNYELELSKRMKCGADVWLNTPLRPMEASGTSGMSATMNGALHFSILDGWAVEGTLDGINGFIINRQGHCTQCSGDCDCSHCRVEDRNAQDYESMMHILENRIIPLYYENPSSWAAMMRKAIQMAGSYFHSERMVVEYYNRLYEPICPCP